MTRTVATLDEKDVDEIDVIFFNFAPNMEPAEAIESVSVTIETQVGTDLTPENMFLQIAQVDSRRVLQQVGGGVEGASYLLRCEALLDSGRKLVLAAVLPVVRLE